MSCSGQTHVSLLILKHKNDLKKNLKLSYPLYMAFVSGVSNVFTTALLLSITYSNSTYTTGMAMCCLVSCKTNVSIYMVAFQPVIALISLIITVLQMWWTCKHKLSEDSLSFSVVPDLSVCRDICLKGLIVFSTALLSPYDSPSLIAVFHGKSEKQCLLTMRLFHWVKIKMRLMGFTPLQWQWVWLTWYQTTN